MDVNIKELLNKYDVMSQLKDYKKVYFRNEADKDQIEKIRYKIDKTDWLIYVDGNTFRSLIRGFAICESGIAFCDDNEECFKLSIEGLKNSNISSTQKSLLINGKSITLGEISSKLSSLLILVRRDLKGPENKIKTFKVANLGEVLWYAAYEGVIEGPFSKEEIQQKITRGDYFFQLLQLWNSRMTDWELAENIKDFTSDYIDTKSFEDAAHEKIDINYCSKEDLLKIPGFSEDKIDEFIRRRSNGIMLRNIYELRDLFEIEQPHILDSINSMVKFRLDERRKKVGRVLDV